MRIVVIALLLSVLVFSNDNLSKKELERMAAKMVVLGFHGTKIDENSQIYKDVKAGLGGVILFDKDPNDKTKEKNIVSKEQLKELNISLQNISSQKLLIGIDQEGGAVQRLNEKYGFSNTLRASEISKNGEEFAKNSYKTMANELNSVGINLNFAPSVDLAINEKNRVIVTRGRSYSKDSDEVIKYSSIFVEELKNKGIFASLKHFPGHGSSLADSHHGFVDITKTWSKKELEPYRYFIDNDIVDIIMTAHVFNSNLDEYYPATLSYNINTTLLREELGFEGVLITDDLQMSAITKHYSTKETIITAINSGVNLLLFANQLAKPIKLQEIVDVVVNAVETGDISIEKIIDSNKKIDNLLK
ncbi:glycoside hydrolase family 3 N-terminal domain-containing protein [Arcobacter porcinus]|uniref:Glycosyl hydrolase, family 3 n=1 Tax=Arcobacter porcinus TaxID=1935204 RepID=A0A5C2HG63_9BACT|nr:glycoside hydrolase family 3 N-terminal domain-containing protein [Arcobacter porcinus]OCL91371.1 Beta-hexosaminidase A precursor [Aliarcobacter thereius]QEP40311.1 glycosyl hydrolase, family 3 [Arcobacter porcinus]